MSQNTTKSPEPNSPTTSSLLTNLQMLLERMQYMQNLQIRQLEISLGFQNDCNLSYKSLGLLESTLFARHRDLVLKSSLETLKLISQQGLHYGYLLGTTLKQLSTNTERSSS